MSVSIALRNDYDGGEHLRHTAISHTLVVRKVYRRGLRSLRSPRRMMAIPDFHAHISTQIVDHVPALPTDKISRGPSHKTRKSTAHGPLSENSE
jgi:hypothetical protein